MTITSTNPNPPGGLFYFRKDSVSSPRDKNGKLILKQNAFSYSRTWYFPTGAKFIWQPGASETQSILSYSGTGAFGGRGLYNQLYGKLVEKIHGSDLIATAVESAELKESVSLVKDAAVSLLKGARLIRARRFQAAKRHFGLTDLNVRKLGTVFKDNWMAYRYGWTPLLSSIYSAVLYAGGSRPEFAFVKTKGGRESKIDKRASSEWFEFQVEGNVTLEVTLKGIYHVTDAKAVKRYRDGLSNPALVAWELVPLSFVADWFINVGDMVSSLTDLKGITFQDFAQTTTVTAHESYTYRFSTTVNGVEKKKGDSAFKLKHVWKSRTLLSAPTPPSFLFEPDITTKRAIDALCLISNFFRR